MVESASDAMHLYQLGIGTSSGYVIAWKVVLAVCSESRLVGDSALSGKEHLSQHMIADMRQVHMSRSRNGRLFLLLSLLG
jgi:hypothetical protein